MPKIDFEYKTPYGTTYRDRIYYVPGETLTEEQIENMKQERINAYLSKLEEATKRETPPTRPIPAISIVTPVVSDIPTTQQENQE